MRRLWLAAALLCLFGGAARAEEMLLNLSSDRVVIASNFTGTAVTLFGAILPDQNTVTRVGAYDVVVTVRGPNRDLVVRKKERVFGIWINRDQRTFPLAPSFLAVLTSSPPSAIANPDMQERYGIGLLAALPGASAGPGEPFAEALVRHYEAAGLYQQVADGVQMLSGNLFRTTVPLPANVPIGVFQIEVKLFSDGVMLADEATAFTVAKSGFEAQVARLAEDHSWVYGFGAAGLAIIFGWLATVVFRRD